MIYGTYITTHYTDIYNENHKAYIRNNMNEHTSPDIESIWASTTSKILRGLKQYPPKLPAVPAKYSSVVMAPSPTGMTTGTFPRVVGSR